MAAYHAPMLPFAPQMANKQSVAFPCVSPVSKIRSKRAPLFVSPRCHHAPFLCAQFEAKGPSPLIASQRASRCRR
eukprot:6209518-Pleurochrysis_carterae.AAC.3